MLVTPLFTAIFALFFVVLTSSVIKHRIQHGVPLGDGDKPDLNVAIRTQANFVENVPLALLLMWFIEISIFDSTFAFVLGVILLIGRILHVVGMNDPERYLICRQIGVIATLAVMIGGALRILWHYLPFA